MYLEHVSLKWSQTDFARVTHLFYKIWKSQQTEYKKQEHVHVRIVHVQVLVHVADLNLTIILKYVLCLHFYQNTGSKFLSIVNYSWYGKDNIFEISGQVVDSKVQEPQHLCHVLTTGVFPVMAVSDARCYGSAVGISKKQLWALFSLDKYVFHWPVIQPFLSYFWNQSIW